MVGHTVEGTEFIMSLLHITEIQARRKNFQALHLKTRDRENARTNSISAVNTMSYGKSRIKSVVLTTGLVGVLLGIANGADTNQPVSAVERRIVTESCEIYPPLFLQQAGTLDPSAIARECWKGYLTKQPDPWGMTGDLNPTLRLHFDDRALPWPRLKHHEVDGFDNNARGVGAHALLHQMFGPEKDNDLAEAGEIAYLLGCVDPESGLAYSPDRLPRECPLAEGEMARNVMLLYEQTKNPMLWDWSKKMLTTLRRYAVVGQEPGVGEIAWYNQGGNGGQGGFIVGEPPLKTRPADPTLDGWEYVYVGWNARAFLEDYRVTGDTNALDFAVALDKRLCHGEDANGDDGSLRPDGSFGGKAKGGSWHMHGHTHCLPGLVSLGEVLLTTGQRDQGLKFINQAGSTMDWLYDSTRNPDAGSMTGWLGEFLAVAAGWTRKADCEGCTMGDVTQTACALGGACNADPSLAGLGRFYDRAEQIYSSQVTAQMFHPRPDYLAVVKDCLTKHVNKEMTNATPEEKAAEVDKRCQEAVVTAQRMVGQQLGLCGFPDWVNHLPSDLDADLPGVHMQGCCADATIRASHAIWSNTVTGDENETRVNLAFNRDSDLVKVVSCLPHRGELDVMVKNSHRVLVRVPEWSARDGVKAFVDKQPVTVAWKQHYVAFDSVRSGQQLTVVYPLRIAQVTEPIEGVLYTERWRGNTIVDISPRGKWVPSSSTRNWTTQPFRNDEAFARGRCSRPHRRRIHRKLPLRCSGRSTTGRRRNGPAGAACRSGRKPASFSAISQTDRAPAAIRRRNSKLQTGA